MVVRNVAAVALAGVTVWAVAACTSSASPSAGAGAAPAAAAAPGATSPAAAAPPAGASPASSAPAGNASPADTAPAGVAGTGGSAAAAASTSECANAPSALVGKDLNLAVGTLVATAEDPVTVCAYTGRYEVIVRFQTGEDPGEFAQARTQQAYLHQSVSTVKGLGQTAYLASYTATKPASNTLGALEGNIAIFITSPAPVSAEITLMTDLLKKV